MVRVLFIGDIVGRPGRTAVKELLADYRTENAIDIVIANGENAAAGSGIHAPMARDILNWGVDGITLGDHCWDQRGFTREIDEVEGLCRPANLPNGVPGKSYLVVERNGFRLGVFTVLGRQFMKISSDDLFHSAQTMLEEHGKEADAWLVEVHAETTSEKIAMGWFLDGRASAVVGTHTHIPTADCRVLPRGTAYITDVGMTGPYESVLGRSIQPVVSRFLDGLPRRFDVAEKDVRLCGVVIEFVEGGRAQSIERVELLLPESASA